MDLRQDRTGTEIYRGKWNINLRRQFSWWEKRHFTQHFFLLLLLQKSITKGAGWNFVAPSAAHEVKCSCVENKFSNTIFFMTFDLPFLKMQAALFQLVGGAHFRVGKISVKFCNSH